MDEFWILVGLIALAAIVKWLFIGHGDHSAASQGAPVGTNGDRSHPSNNRRRLAQFPLLRSSDPFDSDGSLIWHTQMPALRMICQGEPAGTRCADLQPIYAGMARRYPEIYDGHTFREWGQLLVDLGLVRVAGPIVHITHAGQALIEMLARATQQGSRECAPGWAIRLNNACRG